MAAAGSAQTEEWRVHPFAEPGRRRLSRRGSSASSAPSFPDAIITTEVGQNQMWAALFYKFRKPRTVPHLGRARHHGLRVPGRHGAQLGNPDRVVIDIDGDGSFQMNIQELATAAA